jgi:hypothetical protein
VSEASERTLLLRRAALSTVLAAGGLAVHLTVQRLAPPPIWRAGDALVGLLPFLPWTIYVYLLFFPFLIVTGALQPPDRWRRLALAWSLASVASWTLVLLVPVTFSRPSLSGVDRVSAWVLGRVWGIDSAHVTFPCLHAAVTWICWHALRDRGPRVRAWVFALAVAITLSTMTTRQHLLTDNAAALAIAWVCARAVLPASSTVRDRGRTGVNAGTERGSP